MKEETKNMSKEAKGQAVERAAEMDIVDAMFEPEIAEQSLKTEKEYAQFGKKIAEILNGGQAPYRIPTFFTALLADIGKSGITAEQLSKVQDKVKVAYNE